MRIDCPKHTLYVCVLMQDMLQKLPVELSAAKKHAAGVQARLEKEKDGYFMLVRCWCAVERAAYHWGCSEPCPQPCRGWLHGR